MNQTQELLDDDELEAVSEVGQAIAQEVTAAFARGESMGQVLLRCAEAYPDAPMTEWGAGIELFGKVLRDWSAQISALAITMADSNPLVVPFRQAVLPRVSSNKLSPRLTHQPTSNYTSH